MKREDVRRLLDRIGALRQPCDLDLLVFFARHPRALLTSEQLAVWLGYEINQIAGSLDLLLAAGILTRTQNPTHAARLYVFTTGETTGGWLPALLKLASTRQGRLALVEALAKAPPDTNGPAAGVREAAAPPGPRPFVVRRKPEAISRTKAG